MTSSPQIAEGKGAFLTWVCGLSSLFLAFVYVSMAVHMRMGLGHWPKPMWEDYESWPFSVHEYFLVLVALFTVWVAVPLGLILLRFRRFRVSPRTHATQALTYALGWFVILAICRWDPTTFTEWFLD